MANFCLSKEIADTLKAAAQAGKIDIAKMFEMSSEERRTLFSEWVDGDTAQKINGGFEEAMISSQQTALKKWAQDTFSSSDKQTARYRDVISKINALNDLGVLNPTDGKSFLEDLVATKLGATVTAEEAAAISEKTTKLQTLASQTDEKTGMPVLEYWQQKRDLENYMDSLNPSGTLKVLTSTIARANMLFRASSTLVNIIGNTEQGAMESIMRRVDTKMVNGLNTNSQFAKDYQEYAFKVAKATGYDVTRMDTLNIDRKTLGEKMTNTQGKGVIHAVGRFAQDQVFGKLQGLPDVFFATKAFSDRMNLESTRLVLQQGLKGEEATGKALDIMKDAIKINPETPEGQKVRDASIADAKRSTNTNETFVSDRALALRNLLNYKDLRFGDMEVPFVKTTANAISSGLDASGITLPVHATIDLIKMVKLVQESDNPRSAATWGDASKQAFAGFGSKMVRAGVGMTAAWLLSNAIKPENFMGVYPTNANERNLMTLENAPVNSVKIGNHWISLAYLGPLAPAVVGFMYAKKYGTDLPSTVYNYFVGAGNEIPNTPGLSEVNNLFKSIQTTFQPGEKNTISAKAQALGNMMVQFVADRTLPGFVTDTAKATDPNVRDATGDMLAPIKNNIPGLRETLPEKRDVFGQTPQTEGWLTVLFGSRMKTGTDDPVVTELQRLDSKGHLPAVSDVAKTSPRAAQLREQVGDDKFDEAMRFMGTTFHDQLTKKFANPAYSDLPIDKKEKLINDVKDKVFTYTLQKYGYKKPPKTPEFQK